MAAAAAEPPVTIVVFHEFIGTFPADVEHLVRRGATPTATKKGENLEIVRRNAKIFYPREPRVPEYVMSLVDRLIGTGDHELVDIGDDLYTILPGGRRVAYNDRAIMRYTR